jgi:aspartate aminotransferase-like enzyme
LKRRRLFTPGPTPVPDDVALQMAAPLLHHRTSEFRALVARVTRNLQTLFHTAGPVVTLTCSGTGAMESTVVSLFSPGDRLLAINGGKFGERWVQMPRMYGMTVEELRIPWGEAVRPELVAEALRRAPETKGVYLTHCETSTGTLADVRALAEVIRATSNALVCVDGISSVGAHELRCDPWGIDVCVTGSQKGLMTPPGLALVALGERALAALERSTTPRFYLDLRRAVGALRTNDTPWTPAVSLMVGLDRALGLLLEEGVENVWSRHALLAKGMRAGLTALGLRLFSSAPCNSLTAAWLPEGVTWNAFRDALARDGGITLAGGQGDYAGKIFRVAHLGYYDALDVVTVMAGIERAFAAVGGAIVPGAGVNAAQRALLA